MAKRVFISSSFAERDLLNNLLGFFQENDGPVQATPAYMTQDRRAEGDARIKEGIREIMKGCSGLIVLVGEQAHNSKWIEYEVGVAASMQIPHVGVRHSARHGGFPNTYVGMQEVPWHGPELARVVAEWR
jgi:hypothetical protein